MNIFTPKVGEICQMIYTGADRPTWISCIPKAISELGIAVGVDIEGEGEKTLWFNKVQITRDIVFRPSIGFHSTWKHHSGEMYSMICIANEFTTRPDFERVVVYQHSETKVLYARSVEEFLEKFIPVYLTPIASEQAEECEIINSQDKPVIASPVMESAQ